MEKITKFKLENQSLSAMEEFRQRPKGEFLEEANWSQLYVLTQHWISDLQFFKEDLNFLNRLIEKYFIWLTRDENLEAVKVIQEKLKGTRNSCTDLLSKTQKHLVQLGSMIEKDTGQARVFRMEHEHLEDEIMAFVKAFRQNRKEVFRITEHIMDTEELSGITGK